MVFYEYSLPKRKARICRVAGAVFLFLAVWMAGAVVANGIWPGLNGTCGLDGCDLRVEPVTLLPDDEEPVVARDPVATARFVAYVARPAVQVGLVGIELLERGFFALLLLGVGMALRVLGGSGGDMLATALRWLRLASLSAMAWVVAIPVVDSLRAMLLLPGTPMGPYWYFILDFDEIGPAAMLAVAAFATVWALEAGSRASRDLAEFV